MKNKIKEPAQVALTTQAEVENPGGPSTIAIISDDQALSLAAIFRYILGEGWGQSEINHTNERNQNE